MTQMGHLCHVIMITVYTVAVTLSPIFVTGDKFFDFFPMCDAFCSSSLPPFLAFLLLSLRVATALLHLYLHLLCQPLLPLQLRRS